jgi:hypothetical protein
VTTRDEAIAECMAAGLRFSECAATVDDRVVDGVYCDGTVVMTEAGSRCVSRATVDRKRAASTAEPLPEAAASPPPRWAVPLTLSLAFRALCALSDIAYDR